MERLLRIAVLVPAALLYGCGGDDETCDPIAQEGCDDGFVCEVVDGQEEPACFEPLLVRGGVFDLSNGGAVESARIVGLDPNSSPVSSVAISDVDGQYELAIPTTRTADGTPIGYDITLRADASGYQTFPGGVRQALPVDTTVAVRDGDDGPWVVESALTDIGLLALPADAGTAFIHGTVEVPEDRIGTLVVAEGSDGTGYSAVADRDGDYAIFNLPADDYLVKGYARYVNYDPVEVSLGDGGEDLDVDLSINDTAASTLTGSVQFANPGDGQETSIILVVASTFDPVLQRGQTPPGLRAPDPGIAPNVINSFSIEGVPQGDYYILAAFENDFFVRDPDPCIAGTDLVAAEVGGAATVDMEESFKITGSLDLYGPGADGAEPVSGNPTFEWVDDSSEEAYDVLVVDSFGEVVWETRIDGVSGGDVSLAYDGPALEPGMYYQWRVTSVRRVGEDPECKISTTEDLRGVFYLE
ncbi:MAG TPA: carboxypeptidase-like regulatory domain-containing protein [Kofleriaceae bacterium]|nr:carboxypeptidase-like regulatory domain-containing protein [Kofleriaceae bacterium]